MKKRWKRKMKKCGECTYRNDIGGKYGLKSNCILFAQNCYNIRSCGSFREGIPLIERIEQLEELIKK